ncbi:MAG: hypothetical protein KJ558_13520, partial [Gammaproteobacteria bacterium]|nr:hypothetical protein [Gammaproteobacteria bacterium]MBU1655814.1 hypothetical protein [Gammaproteobacteria bacterium]MBU1962394.1 hypothetical protein [Gammaproteobacteria bacterium]
MTTTRTTSAPLWGQEITPEFRGSCKTARTSCGSGMNRHFQWPKPLKMKKTKNRIFRFRLAKWSGRP